MFDMRVVYPCKCRATVSLMEADFGYGHHRKHNLKISSCDSSPADGLMTTSPVNSAMELRIVHEALYASLKLWYCSTEAHYFL